MTVIKVGFESSVEPPPCHPRLLPPSPSSVSSGASAPSPGAAPHSVMVTLLMVMVEVLRKDYEDALGEAEDLMREL